MKTKRSLRDRFIILVIVVGVILAAILLLLVLRQITLDRTLGAYPLVLIHSPTNHGQIALGDLASVHASASSPEGVKRIELWVDGDFIKATETSEEETYSPLVLVAGWQPRTLGPHILVVRATSSTDVEGQATIYIEAIEGQGTSTQHMIEDGETLEQIAADHGLDTDELVDMNPGFDPTAYTDGDFVNVPGGDSDTGGDDDSSTDDSDQPQYIRPRGIPIDPFRGSTSNSDEPYLLRIEILALETGAAYESLHCYAGVGFRSPRWYPDTDGDQETNEYFSSADGSSWNVADDMAENMTPVIFWSGDAPLPFTITCVGIQGGGTEALELGPLSLSILPELWDGITRTAHSDSGDGSFSIEYRVTLVNLIASRSDMARPINLWINYNGGYLAWDYRPQEDEAAIDGFMVFLNDTLIWQVSPDERRVWLPEAYMTAPCGEEYEFTVRSFIDPYPYGDRSIPREIWQDGYQGDRASISGAEPGTPECARRYVVEFQSLTTGTIPEDPVPRGAANWDHGLGPIAGMFFTSNEQHFFGFWRFVPDHEYRSGLLFADSPTSGTFLTTIDENIEDFWVGFLIQDNDGGSAETLCQGEERVTVSHINNYYEGEILSDEPGRCSVAYTIRPASGSPAATGDELLLPQLYIESFTREPSSGELQIEIHNVGTTDLVHQDLDVHMTKHSGELIDDFTLEDFYLAQDETVIYQVPGTGPDLTFDACVKLDPEDKINEYYEYYNIASGHGLRCQMRPDLSISDVQYDPATEALFVTIQNHGELPSTWGDHLNWGTVHDRDLDLRVVFDDGSFIDETIPHVSMDNFDEIQVAITGIGVEERSRMFDGYSVIVDPDNKISEPVDVGNNEYRVRDGVMMHVYWIKTLLHAIRNVRWHAYRKSCHDSWERQDQEVSVEVFVESEYESNRMAGWSITQHMSNEAYLLEYSNRYLAEFPIFGDEILTIAISGEVNDKNMGAARFSYGAEDSWGRTQGVTRYTFVPSNFNYQFTTCQPWWVRMVIADTLP